MSAGIERIEHPPEVPAVPHLAVTGHDDGAEEASVNPVQLIHHLLRGRYWFVAIVSGLLAAVGGAAGFLVAKPEFVSIGMIEISANKPSLLYDDRDDSRMRLFDAYVSAEVSYLRSRPVLERAATMLELEEMPAEPIRFIRDAMTVDRKGAVLLVTVKHGEAATAATIVNSLLTAYEECRTEEANVDEKSRERTLSERERGLVDKLSKTDDELLNVGQEFGLGSIATAHVRKIALMETVDERVSELEMKIATREATEATTDVDTGDEDIKRLIVLDHATADMLFDRTKRAARLAMLKSKHAPGHYQIAEAEEEIAVIDAAIEDRRRQLTTLGSTGALTKTGESGDAESLEALRTLKTRLETRREGLRQEAIKLNSRLISLGFLEEEREAVRDLLDDTRKALDAVRVESRSVLPGTAVVRARGRVAESPATDKRKAFAVVGAGGGGGLGVVASVLLGFVFRRYRFSDELGSVTSRAPLMGVLPRVDEDPTLDPSFNAAIHRMRCELELAARSRKGCQVVVVTSQQPMVGGSSVSVALAGSCADTRRRTLLVDLDLLDTTTTHRIGLADRPGVRELLIGGAADPVRQSEFLDVLPAGEAKDFSDRSLSHEGLTQLLAKFTGCYDVLVLDVGPFSNRISARLGAARSDQVLLVTRAGTEPGPCHAAVDELSRIAPGRLGLAFNLAASNDAGLV